MTFKNDKKNNTKNNSKNFSKKISKEILKEKLLQNFCQKNIFALKKQMHIFDAKKIPQDAQDALEVFDEIIKNVRHLSYKQQKDLPKNIHKLSALLTSDRATLKKNYMNDTVFLSAYAQYFEWWNLVRLVRFFANNLQDFFYLQDGDVCVDVGSGPLSVVCALWLACPFLREKKLTWYCIDISKSALSLGEDIFLTLVSRFGSGKENWKIVRVADSAGASIKQKAKLVTCANMFNETYQTALPQIESYAEKCSKMLLSYADDFAKILVVEPGVPTSAQFISLLRDNFLQKNMRIISPCSHAEKCTMCGKGAHKGGTVKWCNFSFDAKKSIGVPVRLQKISESAELAKSRAVMSFIFVEKISENKKLPQENKSDFLVRIASEEIKLMDGNFGFYGCSKIGLVLVINKTKKRFASGDLLCVQQKLYGKNGGHNTVCDLNLPIDKKSGAKIIIVE